jgi:hypothetical protein
MESAGEKPQSSTDQNPVPAATESTAGHADDRGRRRSAWVAGAIAVGALVLEPELLPGMAIGIAAVALPKLFPRLAARVRPAVQSAWRATQDKLSKGRDKARALGGATAHEAPPSTPAPEAGDVPRQPA